MRKIRESIYENLIWNAQSYLSDIMAELAEAHYEDEGGMEGLSSGAVELSDNDIKYCMGDALLQVIGFDTDFDLEPVIDYWFKRDYRR